jgi:hypothetical protein
MLVFKEVSSMKAKRGRNLRMKGLTAADPERPLTRHIRAELFSCAQCFFMREPQPVQPIPHTRNGHADAMFRQERLRQGFLRHVALPGHTLPSPIVVRAGLAPTAIALRFRFQRPGLTLEPDHVVDELDRDPEMRRRRPVRIAFLHERDNALPQFHGMWLAHSCPLYLPHKQKTTGASSWESRIRSAWERSKGSHANGSGA